MVRPVSLDIPGLSAAPYIQRRRIFRQQTAEIRLRICISRAIRRSKTTFPFSLGRLEGEHLDANIAANRSPTSRAAHSSTAVAKRSRTPGPSAVQEETRSGSIPGFLRYRRTHPTERRIPPGYHRADPGRRWAFSRLRDSPKRAAWDIRKRLLENKAADSPATGRPQCHGSPLRDSHGLPRSWRCESAGRRDGH